MSSAYDHIDIEEERRRGKMMMRMRMRMIILICSPLDVYSLINLELKCIHV
jgi:hypothetical protein